ncbi:MAG TPA: CPBP family intramembrane glutamic endopeptidase [Gaiellaceae bacterium]|nr:CPBP family intramembrane glutamic endopeptidase [Gaiellaceae bacterium]
MLSEVLTKNERTTSPPMPTSTVPDSAEGGPRPYRLLPLWQAFLYFGVPGLTFFVFVWVGIPALTDAGLSEFAAFLWALLIPSALLLVAALVGLRSEGWSLTGSSLRQRFRYRRMTRREWLWTGGAAVVVMLGFGLLTAITNQLIDNGLIPLPGDTASVLDPRASSEELLEGYGGVIVGRWELVALYFVALSFNIVGEELWWRGYILPRQELAHTSHAWLANGLLWAGFHFFKWWEILALLPMTLTVAFISQKLQNNTPALIVHYLFNGVSFVVFVLLVAGVVEI